MNFTGCGNTLNLEHPRVVQMVMDALRYWVTEMEVDGFRFDLAVTLAREQHHFKRTAGFLTAVGQDPELRRNAKLIAEPWDLGVDGYQLGQFPPGWSEWNDQYRDTVRRFWKGDGHVIGKLASRLTGSSDIFEQGGRRPQSSINFVTAHDGFTLEDLVSYEHKHNEANSENNRDGTNHNWSWNGGVEGPTDDLAIRALRTRQKRNMIASLLLSQGVPMICAGDEFGRTQHGNNNAYCHDNAVAWIDWESWTNDEQDFLEFVQKVLSIRARHPIFRRTRFFHGNFPDGEPVRDITWFNPAGHEMTQKDWNRGNAHCLAFHMDNSEHREAASMLDEQETPTGFMIMLNGGSTSETVKLPGPKFSSTWQIMLDTGEYEEGDRDTYRAGDEVNLEPHTLMLLAAGK